MANRYYTTNAHDADAATNATDAILDGTIETLMQIVSDDTLPIGLTRQLFLVVLNLETIQGLYND